MKPESTDSSQEPRPGKRWGWRKRGGKNFRWRASVPASREPSHSETVSAGVSKPLIAGEPQSSDMVQAGTSGPKLPDAVPNSPLGWVIDFCMRNKAITVIAFLLLIVWGIMVAPFNWDLPGVARDADHPLFGKVAVDAIPDLGENQQIIFTKWPGRSPQDIEDQITYPLTKTLTGLPGVRTVRSMSMFGFSSIYVIFEEDIDFYWSRSRILEKLNSLPSNSLPPGVTPQLGPDATALGQVFWYTLEGQNDAGEPVGGWDPDELRSIQDWTVRYALLAVPGVSEVASVGGHVKEYQIDVDPDAMRAYGIGMNQIYQAVRTSNRDVGGRTIEVNNAEYVIRGIGYVKSLADIENSVISEKGNVPVYVKNVAQVRIGPAQRRGLLDKNGAEVTGGVVIVRYGENPMEVISRVKTALTQLAPSLPRRELADGTISQVTIEPFYDRTGLILETLGTLNSALYQEILVTIIVILLMIRHIRLASVISVMLPVTVLLTFILMKAFNVTANIVALSGIAIAIGTIVDMGIVVCENIIKHLDEADEATPKLGVVLTATKEVAGAVLTAVATTVVSFLPVFSLQYEAGRLFHPLAFTKTFTLSVSVLVALILLPVLSYLLLCVKPRTVNGRKLLWAGVAAAGVALLFVFNVWAAAALVAIGLYNLCEDKIPKTARKGVHWSVNVLVVAWVVYRLGIDWLPIGPERGDAINVAFVAGPIIALLAFFFIFQYLYEEILALCLKFKQLFLLFPVAVVVFGALGWLGVDKALAWFDTAPGLLVTAAVVIVLIHVTLADFTPIKRSLWVFLPLALVVCILWYQKGDGFSWIPDRVKEARVTRALARTFPGLNSENRPRLDEGSFLYMPSIAYHGSIGEIKDTIAKQDMNIAAVPEVTSVVGKAGRADTPLDPAPLGMVETVVNYHTEFITDENGYPLRFKFDPNGTETAKDAKGKELPAPDGKPYVVQGQFLRENGELVRDPDGMPFRQWRPTMDPELNQGREPWQGIRSPEDIWDEIVRVADVVGSSDAYILQPIETRIVMLQSGMKAKMGVKVQGTSIEAIEESALMIEGWLKDVEGIRPTTVLAKRIQGKPYLEIIPDRQAIARLGIKLGDVLDVIEVGIGGRRVTETVEGRERYPVRIRFQRERRDGFEAIGDLPVSGPGGTQVPLRQLAELNYRQGPQNIITEDGFYMTFVSFGMQPGFAESEVAEAVQKTVEAKVRETKDWPGARFFVAGEYQKTVQTNERLRLIIPVALIVIFIILYLQFRSFLTSTFVFSGILVAWAGGFILLWAYGQDWFLNVTIAEVNLRELFNIRPINMNVAVWVGFLALFGIATDDGVVMATYVKESLAKHKPEGVSAIRQAIVEAGHRRIRPCLMTTATTILALLPVLTSTGKGSDIMLPMAIPVVGGMIFELITMLVVPVLYSIVQERKTASL